LRGIEEIKKNQDNLRNSSFDDLRKSGTVQK